MVDERRVDDLEDTITRQGIEIGKLMDRVERLEREGHAVLCDLLAATMDRVPARTRRKILRAFDARVRRDVEAVIARPDVGQRTLSDA